MVFFFVFFGGRGSGVVNIVDVVQMEYRTLIETVVHVTMCARALTHAIHSGISSEPDALGTNANSLTIRMPIHCSVCSTLVTVSVKSFL